MNGPSKHTDRAALERKRQRADLSQADFVHVAAIDEIHYRLNLVNRSFKSPLLIGPERGLWLRAFPKAKSIADDETLEAQPGAHDLVIHAMGLHWANDVVGQLIQSRNALVPDGLFIGCMFGGQTMHELRSVLSEAEIALSGGLSPRVAMMSEIRDVGQLMQRAGFALPVVDKIDLKVSYETIFHLMHDLRRMGETNSLSLRKRGFERSEFFKLANEIYKANFSDGGGRIFATFEVLFLTGWTPHESQPKPLRPGSAQARLADVLKTEEIKLPQEQKRKTGKEEEDERS